MSRLVVLRMALSLLIFSSCAPVRTPPNGSTQILPGSLPNSLFDTLCEQLRSDSEWRDDQLVWFRGQTRPVFATAALRFYYSPESFTPENAAEDDSRDEHLRDRFVPMEILGPPKDSSCRWKRSTEDVEDLLGQVKLVIEVSNVIPNPFAETETATGVFIRYSLGLTSGADWFWMPLQRIDDTWRIDSPVLLDISDS